MSNDTSAPTGVLYDSVAMQASRPTAAIFENGPVNDMARGLGRGLAVVRMGFASHWRRLARAPAPTNKPIGMESDSTDGDANFLAVAANSDLARQLLRASHACVQLLDLSGRLEAMNAHGRKLMEIDDFSLVRGTGWAEQWSSRDGARARTAFDDARAGLSTHFVAQGPTAKGSTRWWKVSVSPLRDDGGEILHILSFAYEITAIKEREAELEREVEERRRLATAFAEQLEAETRRLTEAQRRASHSEKLRLLGGFVGNVMHDINNVLAVIQGAEQLMRRKELEPAVAGVLEEVDKAIDHGRRLVRRLLDFARSEESEAEVFSPRDLIKRDADLVRHLAGRSACVVFDLRADAWPILAEPARLQSVLFNLVSNAREALHETGTIRVAVRNCSASECPEGLPPGDYLVVSVADDGVGMSADVLRRAGEPFFTTKRPGEGTGLGLASAFEFAASTKGRAIVESVPGEKTAVSLYLARAGARGDLVSTSDAAPDSGHVGPGCGRQR
jgi:PAS domain S-box-containing protein